jgi:hypothetical protein
MGNKFIVGLSVRATVEGTRAPAEVLGTPIMAYFSKQKPIKIEIVLL